MPSVHMYIRARAREDTAGVRMRGALSARTILTRSHVCAGLSVRLCFSCTLRVRGFHAPFGCNTCTCMCAHSPARTFVVCTLSGTHMCERVHVHVSAPCGCVISFSKRTLHFAPRLVKPPEGWGPLRSQNSFYSCTSRASKFPTCRLGPKKSWQGVSK